jgi:hypothetical protein
MNLEQMNVDPDPARAVRVTQRRTPGLAAMWRYAPHRVVLATCFGLALVLAACGGSPTPSPSAATDYARYLAYSQCMRSHGIADFPDPQSQADGGVSLPRMSPHGDLDPNNPQAQAALQACHSLLPTGVGAQQPPNQQAMQAALKLSQCMRAHGFPNYPDPQVTGGAKPEISLEGTGIDQNSPAFQTAQQTCRSLLENGGLGPVTSGSGDDGGSASTEAPSTTSQP